MTVPAIFALCLLILLPVIVFRVARTRIPRHRFAVSGATLGMVITPWAFGLYSLFALGPYWAILGFPGLALVWIHEPPGFYMAMFLGFIPQGEVVSETTGRVVIEAFNAVVWALVYGLIGAGIDFMCRRNGRP